MSDIKSFITALSLASAFILAGCDGQKPDIVDKALGLSRDDYKNISKAESKKKEALAKAEQGDEVAKSSASSGNEPPIPEVTPIVSAPPQPKAGDQLTVSLSVTDDVPLRDVLLELARLANVDLEMGSGVSGGIIFKATNRPFSEVVERVCEMAKLRYTLANGVLKVEMDTPFVKNYALDFLNVERSSNSTVTVNTNVLSGGGGSSSSSSGSSGGSSGSSSGGGEFNSGSLSTITSKAESDLWKSFEEGLKQILKEEPKPQKPLTDASADGASASPAAEPNKSNDKGKEKGKSDSSGAKSDATNPLNLVPMQASVPADAAAVQSASDSPSPNTFYVINKQAGIVTIKASEAEHKKILEYINRLKAAASSQVLIEAKIVEVTLDKGFQSGIDWQTLFTKAGYSVDMNFNDLGTTATSNIATFALTEAAGINLDAAVKLTEEFGTSRTLSSPRLNAVNNQQAVLTFAKNQVYFDISVERETNSSSSNNQQLLTVDSNAKTIPIGIILNILPSIDIEQNEVLLNVRPTLSRILEFVEDPAVAFLSSQSSSTSIPANQIPIVEVREIDSILKIKSGQIMVIGGLMEDKSSNTDKGLPKVSEMPILGNLFKSRESTDNMSELVIFIKATIVPSRTDVHPRDKELYNKFTSDPRPLNF